MRSRHAPNRSRALAQLAACLRGEVLVGADWSALLSLANDELVTAELHPLLSAWPADAAPPPAVLEFVAEVHTLNRDRNQSLGRTLVEVTAALNRIGVRPILLKACAIWARGPLGQQWRQARRIASDLDVMIPPHRAREGVAALMEIGFELIEPLKADSDHAIAVLGRPIDAGSIDLHRRAPAPLGIPELDALERCSHPVQVGHAIALSPRPEMQILIACLHDQINDGGFWMGRLHLRHLMDIAALTRSGPIDWAWLLHVCRHPMIRRVVASELLAARRLVGAIVPDAIVSDWLAEADYQRMRLQYVAPAINEPLRWIGRALRWREMPIRRHVSKAA